MFWRVNKPYLILAFFSCFVLFSCQPMPIGDDSFLEAEVPETIRVKAFSEAENFIGVPYMWGGSNKEGIDCSGLIVNVYQEAIKDTKYEFAWNDASVVDFFDRYVYIIQTPTKGDVIFMGEENINHIAIFEKITNEEVWFIDAYSESGFVERRHYSKTNYKIKNYGRLKVNIRE